MDGILIVQIVVSVLLVLNSISLFINIKRTEGLKATNYLLTVKNAFQETIISELMKYVDEDTRDRCVNNARILFNNSNEKVKIKMCEVVNDEGDKKEDKDNDSSRVND